MTSSMMEYLSLQPASRDPFAVGPREHLNQILSMVSVGRNGDYRFLPLLMHKMGEVLPRMMTPMLQNAPENSNMANIDIFDGFGSAGMAQPPAQMHMSMDSEYDRKFSVEEYEKKYAMEMNSTPESAGHSNSSPPMAGHASSEMGSFSVSSPTIVSPGGMDYSANMNGFPCTPMSEMVMSPLGNAQGSIPRSQHPHQQQQQQQQQQHDMSQRMSNLPAQGMQSQPMSSLNMINQQPQQRQASFHMQGQSHMGDFHALHRANTDGGSMVGMTQMGNY